MSDDVIGWLKRLEREIDFLKSFEVPNRSPVTFDHPLTSASWSGSSHSTTAKTLLDLTTFTNAAGETVPADARMVLIYMAARDSGSAATSPLWVMLAPTNTAGEGIELRVNGMVNDYYTAQTVPIPCDRLARTIYYQVLASGVNTMDIHFKIWAYWK